MNDFNKIIIFSAAACAAVFMQCCSKPFPEDLWLIFPPGDPGIPGPGTVSITADTHQRPGYLSADVTINPASDESEIEGYRIYWSAGQQIGPDHPKTGSAITVSLTAEVIPAGASSVKVRTYSGSSLSASSASASFTDLSRYYIFATAGTFNGNIAGIASYNDKDSNPVTLSGTNAFAKADEICNLEKHYALHNLISPKVFKALIVGIHNGHTRRACSTPNCSGGVSEHSDWVLAPDRTYIQAENTGASVIGTANTKGLFAINATDQLASPFTASGNYWTGLESDGTDTVIYTTSTDTCSNWTVGTVASDGQYGKANKTDAESLSDPFSGSACNTALRLLCVEQ